MRAAGGNKELFFRLFATAFPKVPQKKVDQTTQLSLYLS